jgi:hypothetical protein
MTEDIEQVRCPKCGGKIFFDKDLYGWYEKCLYCGWCRDLPGIVLSEGEHRHGGRYSPAGDEKTVDKPLGHGADKKWKNGGA